MISILRVFKFAFQDMVRNLGLSFMTMFILVLMLLSINVLWALDITTGEAVKLVKNQVNISVYLSPLTTEKQMEDLRKTIMSFPEVRELNVTSREEVLAAFKLRHQGSKEVLQALDELGGNPFGPTLVIKTDEPENYKEVMQVLNTPEYNEIIEGKSFDEHEDAIEKIENITKRVEKIGLALSLLFAIISFLIIFNTIRVAIQTQRVEISIKRLVGANNWFIRGPYLVESIVFTVVSVAATIAIVFTMFRWVDPYLAVVFPNGFGLTNYYESHMLYVFGMQTVAVLLLTIISSSLAMRRQLKV